MNRRKRVVTVMNTGGKKYKGPGKKKKKKAKLGSGGRFRALERTLAGRKGVTNPGALAAYIGRNKYGPSKFGRLSAAGRKRAAK